MEPAAALGKLVAQNLLPLRIYNRQTAPNARAKRLDTKGNHRMGFDQYHEPANELSQETRTFARIIASLTEEAEAINWYEQRISVEKNSDAKAIMTAAQQEEFKHFGMDLEFLLRNKPKWKAALQQILFQSGDIVELGEKGEHAEEKAG